MDMQLDLFGGGAPKLVRAGRAFPTHRWYFTLLPPPVIARDMEYFALRMSRRYGARRPVRAGRIHASLNGSAEGEDNSFDDLDAALEVGDAISRPRFDVCFDRLVTRGRPAKGGNSQLPTVLTCSTGQREIRALHADLRRELLRRGLKGGPPAPTPHVTLWYDTGRISELVLTRPFRWSVRQFWLVRTTLGEARPECLGEWRLGR
ncbi:2'-5' RNA ligase family protein [Devosia sp. A8/3-2]|nr:2'-5' RNA ligase family protein [Devosia sp. A8/3-2]